MEDGAWSFGFTTSPSSRGYRLPLKFSSDFCNDYQDMDEDDDLWAEYPCPFCEEEFDLMDLCSHISEDHGLDDDSGVCPVCATRVETDMVAHIMMNHAYIVDRLQKLKQQRNESRSTSFLKKELEDEYFRHPYSVSSSVVLSSKMAPDPLLSFLSNGLPAAISDSVQSDAYTEETLEKKPDEKMPEREAHPSPLSDEEHKEKAGRSQFVQELLLSTMFDDIL